MMTTVVLPDDVRADADAGTSRDDTTGSPAAAGGTAVGPDLAAAPGPEPERGTGNGAASEAPSVVIVDDDLPLRGLMRRLLESGGLSIAGEAENGFVALDVVTEVQPDIVLLDLMMPGLDGRAVLPGLLTRAPRSMIVVVSTLSAHDEADSTFAAGAFAYLEKTVLGDDFAQQVLELRTLFDRALSGETVWVPDGPRRVRR